MVVGVGDNLKIISSCFGGIFAVWPYLPCGEAGPYASVGRPLAASII